MDEMSLIGELRDFYKTKGTWLCLMMFGIHRYGIMSKMLFQMKKKGSKVLLTTRQEKVAHAWKGSWADNCVYKLKLLCHEKAWELFSKKAFQGQVCPQRLEDISHSIVSKCEGLPLALVTLGALLSTKAHEFEEWKRFRLPHCLKPCLLYFGLFPENSFVEKNRLLNLWIAEDFIQSRRGMVVEDVAKEYLLELIQRNLVQISTRYDCGRIRTLGVHDLIHEVLRQKLGELNFCQILTMEENNHEVYLQGRRLSIEKGRGYDALIKEY
ncbi:putative disease resistance RPP13-like protein 3 [Bienertia sinuspersici]